MAIPNPERELDRLRAVLERGVPTVTLITGPAGFFRAEALDAVLARLPAAAEVRAVSGDVDTDGSELADLRGAVLFGRGCWLVVRRGDGWLKRHGAALAAQLARIRPGCGLVVEAAKLDRRTKAGKALVAAAQTFEFRAPYAEPYDRSRSPLEAEMVTWIVGRARQRGLRLTPEAALLILTTVGSDPAECAAEIERLAVRFAGEPRPRGPQELAAELSCSFESTPFELADAVLDRDRARAERSLEAMFRRGVRGREGEAVDQGGLFPFITSWLYQALARTYDGRFLLDRGTPARELSRQLGVATFADRFVQQVQRNPEPRLRRGLLLLHDAQRELRDTGEEAAWILRRFLARYFAEGVA